MSDGRNSPISIMDPPEEPLWFIDRLGDRSLINNLNRNRNHDNLIYHDISVIAATYPTNYNYNYINHTRNHDNSIYYSSSMRSYSMRSSSMRSSLSAISLVRSIPSELVLDEAIEFSEEQCECCICMDQKEAENICQLNCGHSFCVTCIDSYLKSIKNKNIHVICALCRRKVKKITFKKKENKDKIQECL